MNKFLAFLILGLPLALVSKDSDSEGSTKGDSSPGLSDDGKFALMFAKKVGFSGKENSKPDKPKKKKRSPRMESRLKKGKRVTDWENGGTARLDKDKKYTGFTKDARNKAKLLHSFAEAADEYSDLALAKKDDGEYAIPAFLWMDKDLDGRKKIPCQVEYGENEDGLVYHRFLKTTKLDQEIEKKVKRFGLSKTKDPKPLRNTAGKPIKFTDGSFVVNDNKDYVEICHPTQNDGYRLFLYK